MKRNGLEKARARLKDAFEAFDALKAASRWDELESAWTRLLTAINAAYSILGQSAKGNADSEGWFARVLGQRRADEVLSYLWHARNSNDHGIEQVIRLQPGGVGIGNARGKAVYIEKLVTGSRGEILEVKGWEGSPGQPLTERQYPPRVHLVPVTDRGRTYQPPTKFLDKPIADTSPVGIGAEVLEFMVILLGEAEDLVLEKGS